MLFIGYASSTLFHMKNMDFERREKFPMNPILYNIENDRRLIELQPDDMHPYVKVFQYPEVDIRHIQFDTILRKKNVSEKDIPDVLFPGSECILTEKALEVVRDLDDFPHQVVEHLYLDRNRNILNSRPTYTLLVGRRLEIKDTGAVIEDLKPVYDANNKMVFWKYRLKDRTMFIPEFRDRRPIIDDIFGNPEYSSYKSMATIYTNSDVRACVERFPLWCNRKFWPGVFMNQKFYEALVGAGLTGLKEFSNPLGKGLENIAHG